MSYVEKRSYADRREYALAFAKKPEQVIKRRIYRNQYLKDNPDKRKQHKLRARYGISLNEFNLRSGDQLNLCAICINKEPLKVDHDHEQGDVRGLLCDRCNRAVGLLHDDPMRFLRAAIYLRSESRIETAPLGIKTPRGTYANKHSGHLWLRYRLTPDILDDLIEAQGSVCPICIQVTRLTVDHDHARGHVRGLLCGSCNRGLGFLRDDPVIAMTAWAYLS